MSKDLYILFIIPKYSLPPPPPTLPTLLLHTLFLFVIRVNMSFIQIVESNLLSIVKPLFIDVFKSRFQNVAAYLDVVYDCGLDPHFYNFYLCVGAAAYAIGRFIICMDINVFVTPKIANDDEECEALFKSAIDTLKPCTLKTRQYMEAHFDQAVHEFFLYKKLVQPAVK